MVSSEIWLSLAKLVHCNEGAGGNRGAWGTFAPPHILAELGANPYSVKKAFYYWLSLQIFKPSASSKFRFLECYCATT